MSLKFNRPTEADIRIIRKTKAEAGFEVAKFAAGEFVGNMAITWAENDVEEFPVFVRYQKIDAHPDLFDLVGAWGQVNVVARYDAEMHTFSNVLTDRKLAGREFVVLERFLHGVACVARQAGAFGEKPLLH